MRTTEAWTTRASALKAGAAFFQTTSVANSTGVTSGAFAFTTSTTGASLTFARLPPKSYHQSGDDAELRSREQLTAVEIERLAAAARNNRWGHRDATMKAADAWTGRCHGDSGALI